MSSARDVLIAGLQDLFKRWAELRDIAVLTETKTLINDNLIRLNELIYKLEAEKRDNP